MRHFLRKEVPERWQGPAGACPPDRQFAKFVVDAYLSRDHLEDVDGSCPLVGLSTDVARSNGVVKEAYREVTQSMVQVFKANLKGHAARDGPRLSLCVGGMVLAGFGVSRKRRRSTANRTFPGLLCSGQRDVRCTCHSKSSMLH